MRSGADELTRADISRRGMPDKDARAGARQLERPDESGVSGSIDGTALAMEGSPLSSAGADFSGRAALVTGGLGFIGSALALSLRAAGARVMVIDSLTTGDGGNRENLRDATGIEVVIADIADKGAVQPLLEQADIVFNLSGKVSHIDSVNDPLADLHANTISQLAFLENCRRTKPTVRIVHTSTRQIYGKADTQS